MINKVMSIEIIMVIDEWDLLTISGLYALINEGMVLWNCTSLPNLLGIFKLRSLGNFRNLS